MAGHSRQRSANMSSLQPAPENEDAHSRQAEENEVYGNYVVKNLLILSRKRNGGRQQTLHHDRDDRYTTARTQFRYRAKKQSILGHRKIDARRRQHTLAEKAQCGDSNPGGNQSGASRAQRHSHNV